MPSSYHNSQKSQDLQVIVSNSYCESPLTIPHHLRHDMSQMEPLLLLICCFSCTLSFGSLATVHHSSLLSGALNSFPPHPASISPIAFASSTSSTHPLLYSCWYRCSPSKFLFTFSNFMLERTMNRHQTRITSTLYQSNHLLTHIVWIIQNILILDHCILRVKNINHLGRMNRI
jgi:hypothetical protein